MKSNQVYFPFSQSFIHEVTPTNYYNQTLPDEEASDFP